MKMTKNALENGWRIQTLIACRTVRVHQTNGCQAGLLVMQKKRDVVSCIKLGKSGLNTYLLYWCEKARKHMRVTDRHGMTLAVKVALNPNTNKQTNKRISLVKDPGRKFNHFFSDYNQNPLNGFMY